MMEPDSLARFRAAVADEARGKELEQILAALAKKGFAADSHDRFKRVPKGYDAGPPARRASEATGPHRRRFPRCSQGAPGGRRSSSKWLADACKAAAPLVEWLAFATA